MRFTWKTMNKRSNEWGICTADIKTYSKHQQLKSMILHQNRQTNQGNKRGNLEINRNTPVGDISNDGGKSRLCDQ